VHVRHSRWVAPAAAATLGVGLLVGTGANTPADASGCRPTPSILSRPATWTLALPQGARAQIWVSGVRLSVVTIPKGSLTPAVATAPTLAAAVTPASMVAKDPNAVVVINGGHFNPAVPGIPEKSQTTKGVLRKGYISTDNNLAMYPDKTVWLTHSRLGGNITSVRGTVRVAAVNWQSLPSSGISVFTYAWGTRAHVYGPRTIVLTRGRVTAIRAGSAGRGRPGGAQQFLTAPAGAYATALSRLRIGDLVRVSAWNGGVREYDGVYPHTPVGHPVGLLGAGTTLVRAGGNNTTCGARDEALRPRSGIGWRSNGDMVVVAASGSGATVHQFSDFMRRLGAVTAINLDGGTSTTLLIRRKVGGPLSRLDRGITQYQRAVVDALTFRAV
jgi:hypothetical protein